jgi:hypothetical protein
VGVTFVEISAGDNHSLGRLSDGSVVAWGSNSFGQCVVPPLPAGLTYVEVSAGGDHSLARRSDGSVVAWGSNANGQCNVPPLPAGLTYVEIAASRLDLVGVGHSVARRSDGTVVAWGNNSHGQCDVPALPAGLTYVKIDAAGNRTELVYDLAGALTSVGAGCGGVGMPLFIGDAPRIGHDVHLALTLATPNSAGFLYYSGVPAAPTLLGSGCVVQLDLTTFSPLTPVVTNSIGFWALTAAVPLDPGLVGLQGALQIALFGTTGPFGVDLSNGLIATIGY